MALRIEGFIGEGDNTAQALADEFGRMPGRVELIINSPGGIATEGAAMLAELQAHGNVHVFIRGLAASAASLVAMGGKTITMHPAAVFMIHDPSGVTIGTARDHRDSAEHLDKLSDTYAKSYSAASGNSLDLVAGWMAEETWLNAEDAKALNFIDEIEKTPEPVALAAFDVNAFRQPPECLLRQWREIEQKGAGNAA